MPFGSLAPGMNMQPPQLGQVNDPSMAAMIPALMKMAQQRQQQMQTRPGIAGPVDVSGQNPANVAPAANPMAMRANPPGAPPGGLMGMLAGLLRQKQQQQQQPGAPMDLAAPGQQPNIPNIPVATDNAPGPNQLTGSW